MANASSNNPTKGQPTDYGRILKGLMQYGLPTLALIISVISILQSCRANDITQQQIVRSNTPFLEAAYFVAKSPDMLADYDKQWLERLKVAVHIVQSRFWREQRKLYNGDPNKWYLFIFVENKGPGRVQNIHISPSDFTTKFGDKLADGVIDFEAPLGVLDQNELDAVLIDLWPSPDFIPSRKWENPGELWLQVTYQDTFGNTFNLPIDISATRPAKLTWPLGK